MRAVARTAQVHWQGTHPARAHRSRLPAQRLQPSLPVLEGDVLCASVELMDLIGLQDSGRSWRSDERARAIRGLDAERIEFGLSARGHSDRRHDEGEGASEGVGHGLQGDRDQLAQRGFDAGMSSPWELRSSSESL